VQECVTHAAVDTYAVPPPVAAVAVLAVEVAREALAAVARGRLPDHVLMRQM
jgi:hypothetical protein